MYHGRPRYNVVYRGIPRAKRESDQDGTKRYSGQVVHGTAAGKKCHRPLRCKCCQLGGKVETGHYFFYGEDGKRECARRVDDLRVSLGLSRVNFDALGKRIPPNATRR